MQKPSQDHDDTQLTDPVCGMKVSTDSEFSLHHDGSDYFFCCQGCAQKFSTDPAYYLERDPAAANEAIAGADLYICPMCPEVESDHPASCPSCGMALEPAAIPLTMTRLEYSCPMHPEVVQEHPGSCPKCGMALESRSVEVEEKNATDPALRSLRSWYSLHQTTIGLAT